MDLEKGEDAPQETEGQQKFNREKADAERIAQENHDAIMRGRAAKRKIPGQQRSGM